VDDRTIATYDKDAATFATEWREQPEPADVYAVLKQFFKLGGTSADIGCGSGRDAAWLDKNGYPATGYDASHGLLVQARAAYPDIPFIQTALPDLDGIEAATLDNVLCETVIMHLAPQSIEPATLRLLDILKPDGVLFLSWRTTPDQDLRDKQGRLYAAFDSSVVREALRGALILLDRETINASSGKRVHRIVAKKR
jgi:SAM-dependent methyltransferase